MLYALSTENVVPTLTSVLQRNALVYGSQPAILDTEGSFTWREFVQRVARAATVLRGLGVERNTTVTAGLG